MSEMDEDRLSKLFERQERLQNESFGMPLRELTREQQIEYIRWNVLALEDELHEALNEVPWKPWAKRTDEISEDRYFKELTDALHFLMNLWLVFLPAESAASVMFGMYTEKADLNARRQADGYDGVSTKCPNCHRAIDEPGAILSTRRMIGRHVQIIFRCSACKAMLNEDLLVAKGLVS